MSGLIGACGSAGRDLGAQRNESGERGDGVISQGAGLRLEAVGREAMPDEGMQGGQVRTAGEYR